MQDKIRTKYFEIKQLGNIVYVSYQKRERNIVYNYGNSRMNYGIWISPWTSVAKVSINYTINLFTDNFSNNGVTEI